MDFKEQKKLVFDILKQGDRGIIAERAGVTRVTVNNALSLDTLEGATSAQMRVWEECLSFVKEKQQRAERIEKGVAEVAETLK